MKVRYEWCVEVVLNGKSQGLISRRGHFDLGPYDRLLIESNYAPMEEVEWHVQDNSFSIFGTDDCHSEEEVQQHARRYLAAGWKHDDPREAPVNVSPTRQPKRPAKRPAAANLGLSGSVNASPPRGGRRSHTPRTKKP